MVSSIGVSRRPLRISDSSSMLDLLTVRPKFTRPSCRAAAAAVDQYLLPAPDLSSKPDRRDRQSDGRTLDCFVTLPAYYADRVQMTTLYLKVAVTGEL